jgi:ubiquitin carboxyl-terminal hydrolase 4/11/15
MFRNNFHYLAQYFNAGPNPNTGATFFACRKCEANVFKTLAQDHLRDCNPDGAFSEEDEVYEFETGENPIDIIDGRLREIKEQKQLRRGDKLALISSKWMALWRDSKATPIDNTELLNKDGNLKPGLDPDYDYEVLPYDVWQYFVKTYNGGPVIIRSVVAIGLFFQVDPYPLSLDITFKESQFKHSVSRFQTIKGVLYEFGGLSNTAPANLTISLFNEKNEAIPFTSDTMSQTLQELYLKDGSKLRIDPVLRHGGTGSSCYMNSGYSGFSPSNYASNFIAKHTSGNPLVNGMVGFQNLGNTCYMNSVLSSLCHCLPFCNSLLKMTKPENIPFLKSFQKLISCYWSNKYTALNPSDFRNKVLKATTLFAGYNQQCAHEFICFLLDALHEDLKKLSKEHSAKVQEMKQLTNESNDEMNLKMDESVIKDKQAEAENDIRKEGEMMEGEKKFESGELGEMDVDTNIIDQPNVTQMPTQVEELFEGKYNSKITCNTCKAQFDKEENFLHLSLPVPTLETKLMVITYFPQHGPAKKYGLRPSRNGNVSELRVLLSQLTGTPVEHLKLSEVYSYKKFEIKDDKLVMAIKDSETIVADEIVPGIIQLELLHRKPLRRNFGTQASLCGFPLTLTINQGMTNNQIHALIQEKLGHLLPDDLKTFENLYQTSLVNLANESDEGIPILTNDDVFNINDFNREKTKLEAEIATLDAEAERMNKAIANQESATNDKIKTSDDPMAANPETNPETTKTKTEDKTRTEDTSKEKVENESSATEDENTVETMEVEEKEKTEKETPKPSPPPILTIVLNWEQELTKEMAQKVFSSIASDESTKPTDAERNFEIELTDSIDMFLAEEEISQDNSWFCPACKQLSPIKKQLFLLKLPHVLVLHLKRFEYTLLYRQKITTLVKYPLLNLNLSAYINPANNNHGNQPHSYNLFAVSNHMGGLSGGHYTAYVRKDDADQENGEIPWFEINDSTASPVDSTKVCSRSGYLLFYHSTSCLCDHFAEMTNILDAKMAKSMDKKLAKEVADGADVTQQVEADAGNSVDGKSDPQDSSSPNERKMKREEDSDGSSPQKKQRRGSAKSVSERRTPNGLHSNSSQTDIISYAANHAPSRHSPPPSRGMTITCVVCNSSFDEDEFVEHVFEKHTEAEALFALGCAGIGDDNHELGMMVCDGWNENQKAIESANTNNQIVQINNNQGNNHPASGSDQI